MGYETVPVVYVDIPDLEKEKELNIRLNKNTGEFDWDLLAKFDETLLSDIGFSSDEPYITENDLIKQLIVMIDCIKFNHTGVTRKIEEDIERYHRLKTQVLHQEFIDGRLAEFNRIPQTSADKNEMTKNYLLHILQVGTAEERQEALSFIKTKFIILKRTVIIEKQQSS